MPEGQGQSQRIPGQPELITSGLSQNQAKSKDSNNTMAECHNGRTHAAYLLVTLLTLLFYIKQMSSRYMTPWVTSTHKLTRKKHSELGILAEASREVQEKDYLSSRV